MFNIKNKIYVTSTVEVDFIKRRYIICDPSFENVSIDIWADYNDTGSIGCLFNTRSIDELIINHFRNSYYDFFAFLNNEHKLYFAVSPTDYMKLFAIMMLELKHSFNIPLADIETMYSKKRLKEFMFGNKHIVEYCMPRADGNKPEIEQMYDMVKSVYTPTGALFDYRNVEDIPLDLAYVLYRMGHVDKEIVNKKIAAISSDLFMGYVFHLISTSRVHMCKNKALAQEWFNDPTIETDDDLIRVFSKPENNLIMNVLQNNDETAYNLKDKAVYDEITRYINFIIDKELDYDSNAEHDRAEYELYKNLYFNNDIDVVINHPNYDFTDMGLVLTRYEKFNSMWLAYQP